jgi:hypothetical protein
MVNCDRLVTVPNEQEDRSAGLRPTRYDKLAANFLAFIHLAWIRLWLRVNEYTHR